MRRLLLGIVMLAFFAGGVEAQSFYKKRRKVQDGVSYSVSVVSLRSIRGWKHGIDLSLNTKRNFTFGAFSYQNISSSENVSRSFQGVQIGLPLVRTRNWLISANQRIGLYDKRFLSLMPTLKLGRKISEVITASTGVGMSDRYPVFDFKLAFHFKRTS